MAKKTDPKWERCPAMPDVKGIGEAPLTMKEVGDLAKDLVNLDVSKLPPEKREDVKEAAAKAGLALGKAVGRQASERLGERAKALERKRIEERVKTIDRESRGKSCPPRR